VSRPQSPAPGPDQKSKLTDRIAFGHFPSRHRRRIRHMSAPVHPAHVHCVAEGYRLSPEIGEPETSGLLRHTGDVGGSQWDLSCTDARFDKLNKIVNGLRVAVRSIMSMGTQNADSGLRGHCETENGFIFKNCRYVCRFNKHFMHAKRLCKLPCPRMRFASEFYKRFPPLQQL